MKAKAKEGACTMTAPNNDKISCQGVEGTTVLNEVFEFDVTLRAVGFCSQGSSSFEPGQNALYLKRANSYDGTSDDRNLCVSIV